MLNAEAPPPPATHDARGRFVKGNPGGPGNTTARRMAEVRDLLFECIDREHMMRLVARVYAWAMEGDMAAVKLLFQYLIGKPVPVISAEELDAPGPEPAPVAADGIVPSPEVPAAEGPEAPPGCSEVAAESARPALSPSARADLRRAARRAAKKAARAARKAARCAG